MPNVINASIDIDRSPQDVFDVVTDPARLPDWQPSVVEASAEPPGIRQVGMRGREVRRVPGGPRTFRWEVTECRPPTLWSLHGIDGAVRAHVSITLAPTGEGTGTRLDYSLWFEGHGIGRLLRHLAHIGSRGEMPAALELLKRNLERRDAAA